MATILKQHGAAIVWSIGLSPYTRKASVCVLTYVSHLFGNFYTSCRSQLSLQIALHVYISIYYHVVRLWLKTYVDGELEGSQSADHEETGTDTSVGSTETELLADLDQTAGGSLTRQALGLVDLGKHGVGGLRDEGGGETGDQAGAQVDTGLCAVGQVLLGEGPEGSLGDLLEDDELGHGVGDSVENVSMGGL